MAERGIHAAAPFPRRSQDHVRVILAEPIVQTGAVHMAGAWFIAGMGRISIKERNTTMASDYVDDFLRDERESFKRKEAAAKGELVAAPAGRKTPPAEPEPETVAESDPETTGSDVQAADDETAPQEAAAEPDTSDDGRPAWASGNY